MTTHPTTLAEIEFAAARILDDVAHEIVRPGFGGPLSEHHWATASQVHTVDDRLAGEALRKRFQDTFPGHGLIIEDLDEIPGDGRHRWYIDPIDGSANHLRGIPYVAVTAGLMIDGEPVVGVVHDLIRDTTLSAHVGGGARIHNPADQEPLSVAPTARLEDAMLIAHISRRGPLLNVPGALQHLLWNVRKIRCMGSIALDLALLAAGEADLLVVGRGDRQRMLDILGGMVVLKEAGGAVCTADGSPVTEATRTLIAGSPALCEQLVEVMAGFDLEGFRAEQAVRPA